VFTLLLSDEDIAIIKANREDLTDKRKKPVILKRETVTTVDPYTQEEITTTNDEMVYAIAKGFTSQVAGLKMVVSGIALDVGDIFVTFDGDVDLAGVNNFEINGILYAIYSIEPKGLGGVNRYEVVAHRVT
jgi:hypothetical protein